MPLAVEGRWRATASPATSTLAPCGTELSSLLGTYSRREVGAEELHPGGIPTEIEVWR